MKTIYCCACKEYILPILVKGSDVYPHRRDLKYKPFWMHEFCGNFVGCHPGTEQPLGCIATQEIKRARMELHELLEPIWRDTQISRSQLYKQISRKLGYKYHSANIRSLEEAEQVKEILKEFRIIPGDF